MSFRHLISNYVLYSWDILCTWKYINICMYLHLTFVYRIHCFTCFAYFIYILEVFLYQYIDSCFPFFLFFCYSHTVFHCSDTQCVVSVVPYWWTLGLFSASTTADGAVIHTALCAYVIADTCSSPVMWAPAHHVAGSEGIAICDFDSFCHIAFHILFPDSFPTGSLEKQSAW